MPVYPKGQNKWRVRIWNQGDRKDWIVEGKKSDAEAFEARERVKIEREGAIGEHRVAPTFSAFSANEYARHAKANLKERTRKNRGYVVAELVDFFGDLKLTEFTTTGGVDYQRMRIRDGVQP